MAKSTKKEHGLEVVRCQSYQCALCFAVYECALDAEHKLATFTHPSENFTGTTCENSKAVFTKAVADMIETVETIDG